MTTCGTCGVHYGGAHTEHCMGCHETFSGAKAGDSHRIGIPGVTEGPYRRRCRTSSEMIEGGMWTTVNPSGTIIWHGNVRKDGQAVRDTRHQLPATPQSDEQDATLAEYQPEKASPQNATDRR